MPPQGREINDVFPVRGPGTINVHGGQPRLLPVDPMAPIVEQSRSRAALKALDKLNVDMDTDLAASENRREELSVQKEELAVRREEIRQRLGNNGVNDFLLSQIQTIQGQLGDTQRQLSESQMHALESKISDLETMLREERETQREEPPPAHGIRDTIQDVQSVLALADMIRPQRAEPQQVRDPNDAIALRAIEIRETNKAKVELERLSVERARLDTDKELRQHQIDGELEIKRSAAEQANRVFESLGQLLQVLPQIVTAWKGSGAPALPAGYPQIVEPQSPPQQPPVVIPPIMGELPPGSVVSQCAQCGARFARNPMIMEVRCNFCGAEYNLNPQPAEDPPPTTNGNGAYSPVYDPAPTDDDL